MLNEIDAKQEVERLRSLRGFPRSGSGELLRVAVRARDLSQLRKAINEIIDTEPMCPAPAILRAMLTGTPDAEAIPGHRVCPLGLCVGDGWRARYFLHTKTEHRTIREEITADVEEKLRGRLDPKKQVIYDSVTPCQCGGKGGGHAEYAGPGFDPEEMARIMERGEQADKDRKEAFAAKKRARVSGDAVDAEERLAGMGFDRHGHGVQRTTEGLQRPDWQKKLGL
jgi:hypothetical protein